MRVNVLVDITRERVLQDEKWGGPEHDDQHTEAEWIEIIKRHLNRACGPDYRKQLVRVAAIVVAALDSEDRKRSSGI